MALRLGGECSKAMFRFFLIVLEMENMIKERYGIIDRDYRLMEVMVLKGAPHYAGKQWKFAGAFYYATTVLTTIGTDLNPRRRHPLSND